MVRKLVVGLALVIGVIVAIVGVRWFSDDGLPGVEAGTDVLENIRGATEFATCSNSPLGPCTWGYQCMATSGVCDQPDHICSTSTLTGANNKSCYPPPVFLCSEVTDYCVVTTYVCTQVVGGCQCQDTGVPRSAGQRIVC